MSTEVEAVELALMQQLTPEQRMLFQIQYAAAKKNPDTAVIMALFSLSRFYLGDVGLGVLQWFFNLMFIGLFWVIADIFTAKYRANTYNVLKARQVAAMVGASGAGNVLTGSTPSRNTFCTYCGSLLIPGGVFCKACGGQV